METQGRYESKAQGLLILIRVAEWDRHGRHLSRGKDSKTLVLAAFFGYFLPLLAESIPPEAYDNTWQSIFSTHKKPRSGNTPGLLDFL